MRLSPTRERNFNIFLTRKSHIFRKIEKCILGCRAGESCIFKIFSRKACKPNPIPRLHFLKDVLANIEISQKTTIRNAHFLIRKWCPNESQKEINFHAFLLTHVFGPRLDAKADFLRDVSCDIAIFNKPFFQFSMKFDWKMGSKKERKSEGKN